MLKKASIWLVWAVALSSVRVSGIVDSTVLAQTQLNVGTSTTQKIAPPPNSLPAVPKVRQISIGSDPTSTLDQPLSLLGVQLLQAVCEAQLDARKALSLMPDLSEAHIRAACPKRLIPKASS